MAVAQIDHVALLLDWSGSMSSRKSAVIQAVDAQVRALAKRSEALKREVRISVYGFGSRIECLIFDTDVLRVPSIASLYEIEGMTRLADAVHKGLDDLETTSTLYGDHAFLLIGMTDGRENDSSAAGLRSLPGRLQGLPENWTVGLLVPDEMSRFEAEALGFARGNIGVWSNDVAEFRRTVDASVESFTSSRMSGQRGTRNLFSTGPERLNTQSVKATLESVDPRTYRLLPVPGDGRSKYEIRAFLEGAGFTYRRGMGHYQWMKGETVQAHKAIMVREIATHKVYTGPEARKLIGLPEDVSIQTTPNYNPNYDVFVQSKSPTRKLIGGTEVLVVV